MSFVKDASRRGWMYTGAIIFNRIVPLWLFRCRRFVIYRLDAQSIDPDPEVKLGWCETEDQYRAVERLTYFDRALAKTGPARAVHAIVNNEAHGAFWMANEFVEESELGVRIVLEPNQIWMFAAMVSKEMRGRGIYSKVLRFMCSELSDQGFDDLLVSVNPDNKPSNHVHKKHAKATVGNVLTIRCLNWAWCFSSNDIAQKSHFTANAKLRPIDIFIP